MTNERMALLELIEKGADADLIRELLAYASERLMATEVDQLTAASPQAEAEAAAEPRMCRGKPSLSSPSRAMRRSSARAERAALAPLKGVATSPGTDPRAVRATSVPLGARSMSSWPAAAAAAAGQRYRDPVVVAGRSRPVPVSPEVQVATAVHSVRRPPSQAVAHPDSTRVVVAVAAIPTSNPRKWGARLVPRVVHPAVPAVTVRSVGQEAVEPATRAPVERVPATSTVTIRPVAVAAAAKASPSPGGPRIEAVAAEVAVRSTPTIRRIAGAGAAPAATVG